MTDTFESWKINKFNSIWLFLTLDSNVSNSLLIKHQKECVYFKCKVQEWVFTSLTLSLSLSHTHSLSLTLCVCVFVIHRKRPCYVCCVTCLALLPFSRYLLFDRFEVSLFSTKATFHHHSFWTPPAKKRKSVHKSFV
jgi:hypothetical protein